MGRNPHESNQQMPRQFGRQHLPPPPPQFPGSSYPEMHDVPPVETHFVDEIKPEVLFDPGRNKVHAEWLKGQLELVRDASISHASLMAVGAFLLSIGGVATAQYFQDPTPLQLGSAFGGVLGVLAGFEFRRALARHKMDLTQRS